MVINLFTYDVREILARVLIVALALLLLIIGVRFLTRIITIPVRRVLVRANYPNPDEVTRNLVRRPSRYLVAAAALAIAGVVLDLGVTLTRFANQLSITLVILAAALFLVRIVGYYFQSTQLRAATGLKLDDALVPYARLVLEIVVIGLGAVFLLQAWGVDVGALIAGLGIAGLAVSLAAQDTIANIFGFVVIVADRPFVVGEWVRVPDCEGTIEDVRLRSTRVRQLDQSLVIVPNSKMASASVVNWSRLGKRMLDVTFGISAVTTPEVMQGLLSQLRAVLRNHPSVESNSAQVYFVNIGAQSLEVLVRAYVMLPDMFEFRAEQEIILLELKREVDNLNLKIASPSQTLYIQNIEQMIPAAARAGLSATDTLSEKGS